MDLPGLLNEPDAHPDLRGAGACFWIACQPGYAPALYRDTRARLVDAVSQFARGQYAEAADTLKLVSADQRVGVGGSRVERMLIDLLEARSVELAAQFA